MKDDDEQRDLTSGGTGSVTGQDAEPYAPPGGAPVGSEGGPDPAGQTPVKGDLEEEEGRRTGPHAGSGA